jgi:hypothetical protein
MRNQTKMKYIRQLSPPVATGNQIIVLGGGAAMELTSFFAGYSKFNFRIKPVHRGCLSVVVLLGWALFCFVNNARAAQRQMTESGNLKLVIRPQIQLQKQGTDVVLKIRLAEGTNVKLWASNSCGFPKDDSKTFTASGTYAVAVQNLSTQGQGYVCAISSDDLLKASIPLHN